jgi:hypothetical protein
VRAFGTREERFWAKAERTPTCWLWTGAIDRDGYGRFERTMAHRVAYELAVGPIPEGLTIDHVKARGCTNLNCVNPAHLEAVTGPENTARGTSFGAVNAVKTHCVNGHEFTEENTYWCLNPGGKKRRQCRACRRAHKRGDRKVA